MDNPLRLEGKVFAESRLIRHQVVSLMEGGDLSFTQRLDRALLALVKDLNLPLPIWLDSNTRQFSRFRMTIFFPDQFVEEVDFDQLQIRLIEEDERKRGRT